MEKKDNVSKFDENFSNSDKKIKLESNIENLYDEIPENLKEIYNDYIENKINKENYKSYQEKLSEIETKNEKESKMYYEILIFLQNIKLDVKTDRISEELENKTLAIKSEILTMMGLFLAIFTFVQVNFTFTQQFLEKYNGYRLVLYITIINAILLIVLGFILEAIGTIVYGENKAREGVMSIEQSQVDNKKKKWLEKICTKKYWKSQKYLWFFPESKLKMKRALAYSLIGLFIIGGFSFYKEKNNYARSYEEIEKIILEKVDKKISSSDRMLSESEKKEIKIEIENNIYRDLYSQKRIVSNRK